MLCEKNNDRDVGARLGAGYGRGVRNDGKDFTGVARRLAKLRRTLRVRERIEGGEKLPETSDDVAMADEENNVDSIDGLSETVRRKTKKVGGITVTLRKTGRPNARRSRAAKRSARMNKSSRRKGARKAKKTKKKRRVAMKRIRRGRKSKRRPGRRSFRSHNEAPLRGTLLFDSVLRNSILPNLYEAGGVEKAEQYLKEIYQLELDHPLVEVAGRVSAVEDSVLREGVLQELPESVFGTCLEELDAPTRRVVLEVYYRHLESFNEPWTARAGYIRNDLNALEIPASVKARLIEAATVNPFVGSVALNRNEELDFLGEDEDVPGYSDHSPEGGMPRLNLGIRNTVKRLPYRKVGLAVILGSIANVLMAGGSIQKATTHAASKYGTVYAGGLQTTRLCGALFSGAVLGVVLLYAITQIREILGSKKEKVDAKRRKHLQKELATLEKKYDGLSPEERESIVEGVQRQDELVGEHLLTENIAPFYPTGTSAGTTNFCEVFDLLNNHELLIEGVVEVHPDGSFEYVLEGTIEDILDKTAVVHNDGQSVVVPLTENSVVLSTWDWDTDDTNDTPFYL